MAHYYRFYWGSLIFEFTFIGEIYVSKNLKVGGNAKARAFFRANGGDVSDKSIKYSSRAATLYKGKIQKLVRVIWAKYESHNLSRDINSNCIIDMSALHIIIFQL